LAPNFTEIEDNVLYVEKEDEFEDEESSEDETPEDMIDDGGLGFSLLTSSDKKLKPLTQKQRKLARS
jgi:hypothetical protein